MPFPNSNPGPSESRRPTPVNELIDNPSEKEGPRDAAHIVGTGRKGLRTLSGMDEAVWPPSLEAALLEALEKFDAKGYAPKHKKGRMPKRNKFISDYIFETAGKRRTPRQVGSRLQRLRDTCNERIRKLILGKCPSEPASTGSPRPSGPASTGSSSNTDSQSDFEPEDSPCALPENEPSAPMSTLCVNITFQKNLCPSRIPTVDLCKVRAPNALSIQLPPRASPPGRVLSQDSDTSIRPLLSSTVQYTSPYVLVPQTMFSVHRRGSTQPLHMEHSLISLLSSSRDQYRYSTELVPKFWGEICSSGDIAQYAIHQTLTLEPSPSGTQTSSTESVLIIYNFTDSDVPQKKCEYSVSGCKNKKRRSTYQPESESTPLVQTNPIPYGQWIPYQNAHPEFSHHHPNFYGFAPNFYWPAPHFYGVPSQEYPGPQGYYCDSPYCAHRNFDFRHVDISSRPIYPRPRYYDYHYHGYY